ncbi:hypothetical protein AMECASPLE_015281 [Ameca splendens]|uniref:Uncharacterized protein n=1 Tax=Ameca splendens TaxID=208324 RepID=A0ABV0YDX4_9TELE
MYPKARIFHNSMKRYFMEPLKNRIISGYLNFDFRVFFFDLNLMETFYDHLSLGLMILIQCLNDKNMRCFVFSDGLTEVFFLQCKMKLGCHCTAVEHQMPPALLTVDYSSCSDVLK